MTLSSSNEWPFRWAAAMTLQYSCNACCAITMVLSMMTMPNSMIHKSDKILCMRFASAFKLSWPADETEDRSYCFPLQQSAEDTVDL